MLSARLSRHVFSLSHTMIIIELETMRSPPHKKNVIYSYLYLKSYAHGATIKISYLNIHTEKIDLSFVYTRY